MYKIIIRLTITMLSREIFEKIQKLENCFGNTIKTFLAKIEKKILLKIKLRNKFCLDSFLFFLLFKI